MALSQDELNQAVNQVLAALTTSTIAQLSQKITAESTDLVEIQTVGGSSAHIDLGQIVTDVLPESFSLNDLSDVTIATAAQFNLLQLNAALEWVNVTTLNGVPIGNTTQATGAFTTLSGTTIDGPLGSVTPAAATVTTFSSTGIDATAATSTKITVTNTGLGVGTTPSKALHIAGTVGSLPGFGGPDIVIFQNNASAGDGCNVNLIAGATAQCKLQMGDSAARDQGRLLYDNNLDALSLWANNSQYVTVSSVGNVEVETGNLVIGTSGKGIDFSATPSTGTSELFDDYEEGTFTAIIRATTDASMVVFAGHYTKIGNTVTGTISVETNLIGGLSGATSITGLPFTSANDATRLGCISVGQSGGLNITAGQALSGFVASNSTVIELTLSDAATGTTVLDITEWSSNGSASLTFMYQV